MQRRASDAKRWTECSGWVLVLGAVLVTGLWAALPAKAVDGLSLQSLTSGQLNIKWDPPDPAPTDYRINWAPADQSFPSWRDSAGNAFLTGTALTLHNLRPGAQYKVRVRARARYAADRPQGPGADPFSEPVVQRVDDYHASTTTGGKVAVGGSVSGRIASPGDVDWFAVQLVAGRRYSVTVQAQAALGAQLIGVYNAFGTAVEAGVEWTAAALVFTPDASGVYHVSVAGTDEATGRYVVSMRGRLTVPGSQSIQRPAAPSNTASGQEDSAPAVAQAQGEGEVAESRSEADDEDLPRATVDSW